MEASGLNDIFTEKKMKELFPEDRADLFFDALYGDSKEGAYDISLVFKQYTQGKLEFEFYLKERSGKCLACNLTYGLPEVFLRHPIINIKKLIQKIDTLLNGKAICKDWELNKTREISSELHVIPLTVYLDN